MQASHARRCAALQAALQQGVLTSDMARSDGLMAQFIDLDQLQATLQHLQSKAGYPANALHTVAVKANPCIKLLRFCNEQGVGAEAASLGELQAALKAGFPAHRIVFDSPAKTLAELRCALQAGVAVNLDNFQELARCAALIAAEPDLLQQQQHQQLVGLRVNPQVGEGAIAALSTGGTVSKFGFPLLEAREQLVQAFRDHAWLNMLHLHVGSQGLDISVMTAGVTAVWGLLQDVQQACGAARVRVLDIGGGLPVDFSSDAAAGQTVFEQQAAQLHEAVPALFASDCPVQLFTENGRSIFAKAGFSASRVECTKWSGGRHIAVIHFGAELFMRACYMPTNWGLRTFVCSREGHARDGISGGGSSSDTQQTELVRQDIAGPLCFQGDRLAVDRLMPKAAVGDWVVVADTGAYTLSMFSRYNSRCSPAVYGFQTCQAGGVGLQLLRAEESLEQVLAFWD